MDAQDFRSLQEAYMEVVEGREGGRFEYGQRHGRPLITPEISQRASEKETLGGGTYERGSKRLPKSKRKYDRQVLSGVRAASDQEKQRARKRMGMGENYDLYDIIFSHLLDEGYAETPEAAEAIMVNMSEEWRESIVEEMLDEAITSEKGKAKAAEMIAKRSTPSGRAKSGKGADVATIKHISRSEREGLGGTPATRSTSGSNRPKSYSGMGGTGNKAARRAGLTPTREKPNAWKEDFELWVNGLVEEGYNLSDYTWDEMYEFYLDEALTGERYKKAVKKPGGTAYSRMVSADPKKRAKRGGRGGESDFGAGDRGAGNRAARRAGTYRED